MRFFRKLQRLPRAAGVEPGPVTPAAWNAMADAIEEMEKRVQSMVPADSPDIGYRRNSAGGFTAWLKRRSRGGGATSRKPWQPSFFKDGETFKCRFNLGTCNNVVASNWNDAFTLPSDDSSKFVVVTVTTASGKVTGIALSVDDSAPAEDVIAEDTPPVTHKIVLGAIGKTSAKMIIDYNIVILAQEVFRSSAAAPAAGAEPFNRWWRWSVQPA